VALAAGHSDIVIEEPAMNDPPQAWRGILKAADRLDANLIVIGSYGFGG
jgi:nucleotide-binding universal stress UspA family protein